MNYTVVTDPNVEAIFRKMWQKDSARFGRTGKKLRELAETRRSEKPLSETVEGILALHIGHYILMYRIDRKNQNIILVDYSHHDEAY
jgi:mRNA-degrading endonuclease RelE of RelBE toxin-antitoxin system